MSNYANTAGPQARNGTNNERHAAWLAALWPSSLGAGRTQASPGRAGRWRRHLPNGALAAVLLGLTAIGGPSMIHPGEGVQQHGWNPPQFFGAGSRAGADHGAPSSIQGGTGGRGPDAEPQDQPTTPVSATSGVHDFLPWQGFKDEIVTSELPAYGPPHTHFFGGGNGGEAGRLIGGGGRGAGFGGGTAQGGGGTSGAPSPPDSAPGQSTQSPYVVDPDDGPHDPPGDTPQEWKPATRPLSAVPEPQTWLMMLFGFASLGCLLRARRGQQLRWDAQRLAG